MRFVSFCSLLIFCTWTSRSVNAIDLSSECKKERYLAVFRGGFVPSCMPDGSYEEIQCHDDECWCVDETGEEKPNTRVTSSTRPNCEYAAFAASEVDIMQVIYNEKGDDIELVPDAFMSKSAYVFPPSTSIVTQLKKYFPPSLWPDFSILVTIKPEELSGGFIFAIMDALESVIQFGVSLSQGENDYTQIIQLWYTDDITQGSNVLTEFIVPSMAGRWSKFAISVLVDEIELYVYCHNYTSVTVDRTGVELKLQEDGLLLVGHAGDILQQPFVGEIQEVLITNNADDASMQCDESFQKERQASAMVNSADEYEALPDYLKDVDTEAIDEDDGSGFSGDDEYESRPTILPLDTNILSGDDNSKGLHVTPMAGGLEIESTRPPANSGELNKDGGAKHPVDGKLSQPNLQQTGLKGDTGEPGPAGLPGVDGLPGQMGEMGFPGPTGPKGEKGESGVGVPGEKGEPGVAVRGKHGEKGSKGEPGEFVAGPPGPPGKGLVEELRNLNTLQDHLLVSRLENLAAFVGPKGEPGECRNMSGVSGKGGEAGIPGLPGPKGERGHRGHQGEKGDEGEPGMPGQPGAKGETGNMGMRGWKGEPGERGTQGLQGPPGQPGSIVNAQGKEIVLLPGIQGSPGVSGERGHKGDHGEKGERGDMGEQGLQGPMGLSGRPGLPGFDGIAGTDGMPGLPGNKGDRGAEGERGSKGEPGVGLPGPPGPPGQPRGRPFFGAEWFAGDSDKKVSEMKGEPGEKGAKGEMGPVGQVTSDDIEELLSLFLAKEGKGALDKLGNKGFCKNCSSVKGLRGARGERGFPGKTGPRGAKGRVGMPGFPGLDGAPGKPGAPGRGVRGPKGEPGDCRAGQCSGGGRRGRDGLDGLPGFPGMKGEKGTDGATGDKGERGERGPPGVVTSANRVVAGPPGPPGPAGPPGSPGETIVGLQGVPGPPGAPGAPGRDSPGFRDNQVQNSYAHGYKVTQSGVLLFPNQDDMSRASLAFPIGTLGYVSDQQTLYLRVPLGWQAVQMGATVPLLETNMANVIPMWMDAPFRDKPQLNQPNTSLRLFALNEPMNGNLGGIAGADGLCYRQAVRGGVDGEFRAILTSRLQDIESIVFSKYRNLPVVNSKGEMVLRTWSSISDGKSDLLNGVAVYTFDGVNVNEDSRWNKKYSWHGAQRNGKLAVNEYCQAWTSESQKELGATSSLAHGQLLDQSSHTCDTPLAVLCIEQRTK